MFNNTNQNSFILDPSDVVVPQGWRVISHGTNFHKWNTKVLDRDAQDLKTSLQIVVNNTLDGGLTCVFENEENLSAVYAGQNEPVIFKVFVPSDIAKMEPTYAVESLRFLKPEKLYPKFGLVPAGTTLVKLAEKVDEKTGNIPVIWYVPEQFAKLLETDLKKINRANVRSVDGVEKEADESQGFDLFGSFAAAEQSFEEEHVLEQEEISDEYYENLEEQQQELIDEELAAEEKLAAKRAKDKEKARAQDKKNIEQHEKERERQIAETNKLREQNEQSFNETSYNDVPSHYENTEQEPYVYSTSSDEYTEPTQSNYPQTGENSTPEYSKSEYSLSETESESVLYETKQVEYTSPVFSDENSGRVTYPPYSTDGYSSDSQHPNSSEAPKQYDSETYQQENLSPEERDRSRRQIEDSYDDSESFRREEARRFQEELQAEAQRRQQKSDEYRSFGHSGVDFSGHDKHSAYSGQPDLVAPASDILKGSESAHTSGKPQSISPEEFKRYEQDFYDARNVFRSYTGIIPPEVNKAYQEASERYFGTQRQIDNGSLVVEKREEPTERVGHGQVLNPYPTEQASNIPAPSRANNYISSPSGDNNSPKGNGASSHTTVHNARTGDAPTPRSATSLKDPPKSPIDNTPLYFGPERFRAIKRLGGDIGDGAYRTSGLIKNQIIQAAYSDSSGAAQKMMSTSRYFTMATAAMDVVITGSGKKDAEKVWAKHIAEEKGIKTKDVDKKDIKDFGKINVKNIDEKIKETLSEKDLAKLHKKFGKEADVGVSVAVGTKNGRIDKRNVFVSGKVDVRISEGKIGALRNQSTNLKAQIKALQAKGSGLTQAERQRYVDLVSKKKATDEKLKNMVGATNSRHQSERLYRQINSMSPKKLNKEIKKLEDRLKKGLKLNKVQTRQLKTMKERKALFDMRKKVAGRGFRERTRRVPGSAGRELTKALRRSGDETFVTMMQVSDNIQLASHFLTNRYVKGALKWSIKVQIMPIKLAARGIKKIDRKLGVSKAVGKQVSKATNAASSKLLHTKPGEKIHSAYQRTSALHKRVKANGGLRKTAQKGLHTAVSKVTPNKVKAAAKKISDAFKRLNNNRLVRGAKAIFKAPFKGIKALNSAFNFIKKAVLKYVLIPVALFLCAAFLVSVLASLILNIPSAVFCNDEEKDGRIDLTAYIETLNNEQKKINNAVLAHKNNTENRGGEYKRVYVNYLGGADSNNYKEILSMTAVYFNQDFANKNAVNDYLTQLFNASNYITTEKSEVYYCSGCEERDYHCYDKPDEYATDKRLSLYHTSDHSDEAMVGKSTSSQKGCKKSALYSCMETGHGTYSSQGCYKHGNGARMDEPGDCDNYMKIITNPSRHPLDEIKYAYVCEGHCDGKHYDYSCPGHTEKICKGHIDLYVNVVCLGFDKIFTADPGSTVGLELGNYAQGDLIGTFNVTYYCAEKYPHICNAGPPYKTASGTTVTPGRTIAVDKSIIPLNTPVIINGHLYVAEDTGGAIKGNRIDIAVSSHQEALSLGRDVFRVYKATEGEEDKKDDVQRSVVDYLKKAKEAASEHLSSRFALQVFGQAKEPEITWKNDRVNFDDEQSFTEKLQKFDEKHKNEKFTNAELNAFEYVQMSLKELQKLGKKRGKDCSSMSAYNIITKVLIPYDKEHPEEYIKSSSDEGKKEELYFEGWNKDNIDWAKNIYENMKSDIYAGLDKIGKGVGSGGGGGSVSLEGVVIEGSKISVKYYSQHDPRWANKPVRSDSPSNTISEAGCGPSSMAIVVSSLTSNTIDPLGMCNKYGKTYYQPGVGSYWSIVPGVAEDYGLKCTELGYSNVQGVVNALKQGKLVVAVVGSGGTGYTGSGYYTGAGHFLVICGVTQDGKFLMADPNEPEISLSGKGVDMQHFLNSGIKTWWTIGK